MFNSKKIKELEGDIKTLYSLFEHLQRTIDSNDTFVSFCTNRRKIDECRMANQSNFQIYHGMVSISVPEPEWKNVSTKEVLGLILKKMGLKVEYTPERIMRDIPAEIKLVKEND